MPSTLDTASRRRLAAAALAGLFEAAHLGWELTHGGIRTHHLLQRADLPGLYNGWGLLVLPLLAAWAAGALPARGTWAWRLGLGVPMVLGLALSAAFWAGAADLTQGVFFTAIALALALPACRAECLLGWVLGMTWTFGALLPTLIGGVLAVLSALIHKLLWPLLRRVARRGSRA